MGDGKDTAEKEKLLTPEKMGIMKIKAKLTQHCKLTIPQYKLWWTFLVAQMVKRLPTVRETRVQSLGRGYLLEKGIATHSSIVAWKIPWTEETGRLQSMGSQRVGHD